MGWKSHEDHVATENWKQAKSMITSNTTLTDHLSLWSRAATLDEADYTWSETCFFHSGDHLCPLNINSMLDSQLTMEVVASSSKKSQNISTTITRIEVEKTCRIWTYHRSCAWSCWWLRIIWTVRPYATWSISHLKRFANPFISRIMEIYVRYHELRQTRRWRWWKET
jgi:hypothetical protein